MISIIIPVYNESELIDEMITRLDAVLVVLKEDYEMVFVDDGSEDDTVYKILQRREQNANVKVLSLSRNFGHQAAITAGMEYAKGDYIGLIDSDLQDPPELFEQMYDLLNMGNYDVVSGFRTDRQEKEGKRFLIQSFHRLFSQASGLHDIEQTGHFSMMNRQALMALLSMKEKNRYLPGLRSFMGFRQTQVEYTRQDRLSGESKMSIRQLFRLAGDALFSFSKLPLRFCLYLGLLGIVVSLIAGVYVLVSKVLGWAPLGWSSTTISIYFLGSIQLTFLGVLGEYVFRIYKESQNRPLYFIRKTYD
ncbi:MAG: glycosyltransferase family 2 protein [Carboxylicivirga sp.]|jgi:dolichol-phosphate mannosyltransferase|nr:glycosyltransferase family 2 protein [Carboxylicivirga sp.]